MRRALAFPVLLTLAGPATAQPPVDAARYGWHAEYAPARAEAARTGKPILLVFRCEP